MAVYFLRYFLLFIEKTARAAAAAFCLLVHNIEIFTYIEKKKKHKP